MTGFQCDHSCDSAVATLPDSAQPTAEGLTGLELWGAGACGEYTIEAAPAMAAPACRQARGQQAWAVERLCGECMKNGAPGLHVAAPACKQ